MQQIQTVEAIGLPVLSRPDETVYILTGVTGKALLSDMVQQLVRKNNAESMHGPVSGPQHEDGWPGLDLRFGGSHRTAKNNSINVFRAP